MRSQAPKPWIGAPLKTVAAWRPISTAPRDGTRVLLRGEGYKTIGAFARVGGIVGWAGVNKGLGRAYGILWPEPDEWMPQYNKPEKVRGLAVHKAPARPSPQIYPIRANTTIGFNGWSAVYVMVSAEFAKVGFSWCPAGRLPLIRSNTPYPVSLTAAWFGPGDDAYTAEQETHVLLKDRGAHVSGGWFRANTDVASAAIMEVAARDRLNLMTPEEIIRTIDDAEVGAESLISAAARALAAIRC